MQDPSNIYKSFQTQNSIGVEEKSHEHTHSNMPTNNYKHNQRESNSTELVDVNVDIEQILNDFEVSCLHGIIFLVD